jgi:hypothetical protein
MITRRSLIVAAAALPLAACQTTSSELKPDPSLTPANSALLVVYRPRQLFHSANPEKPYVYLNGQHIGNLGTGDVISLRVPPGEHKVSMRQMVLFSPAWEIGTVPVTMETGKVYYVRYSYDMTGIVGTYPTGSSSLHQVDEATGRLFK